MISKDQQMFEIIAAGIDNSNPDARGDYWASGVTYHIMVALRDAGLLPSENKSSKPKSFKVGDRVKANWCKLVGTVDSYNSLAGRVEVKWDSITGIFNYHVTSLTAM